MHLKFRNVNDAFTGIVRGIHDGSIPTERKNSRNGGVKQVIEPVLITYDKPCERVLFNRERDANPFMHLYESLWMLAGRNDVDSVAYYAKQMREYSDDGKTLNGAYGYRWRGQYLTIETEIPPSKKFPYGCRESEAKRIDQLDILVDHLKANPNSRRAVLQMWNVEDDLLKIGPAKKYDDSNPQQALAEVMDTSVSSKDVCCNLSVMFTVRDTGKCGLCYNGKTETTDEGYCCGCLDRSPPRKDDGGSLKVLDMTVTNRSNDLIWGLLGANFVHFTILQEYMAARLGVEVGVYHHFTNNLHAYDWNWKPEEWLAADMSRGLYEPYCNWESIPLMKDPAMFDRELPSLVGNAYGGGFRGSCPSGRWNEPFFTGVAGPVFRAFESYKEKDYVQALRTCESIAADDWRTACTNWLNRRTKSPVKE